MTCCRFRTVLIAVCAVIVLAGVIAAAPAGDAVNKTCPISGEPIDGKTVATYKDYTIGFCCPACIKPLERWDDERKEAFLMAAMSGDEERAQKEPATQPAQKGDAYEGDPYTLDFCPISGKKLGSMGDPIVKVYDGREVRFCCAGCIAPFEADIEKGFAKVDEKMIEKQLPYYPLDFCVVAKGKLGSMGEPVNFIYKNRLVRFCCAGCEPKFVADPEKFLKEIDEAIIAKQRKDYPLDTCVVRKGKLGSMGEPVEIIAGNRLVRLCCAGCKPAFEKEPAKYLALIDEAWKKKRGK